MSEADDGRVCAVLRCTRPAAPSLAVCTPCAAAAGMIVARIGTEYELLSAAPTGAVKAGEAVSGGGLKSQKSVGDLDVMVARDPRSKLPDEADPDGNRAVPVLATVLAWAAVIRVGRALDVAPMVLRYPCRQTRPVPRPEPCLHEACSKLAPIRVQTEPTMTSERSVLATHLDWLLAGEHAGVFLAQLRAAWRAVQAANGTAVIPRPRRARCRAQDAAGTRCTGMLDWDGSAASCPTCGGTWSGLAVLRIGG